MFLNIDPYTYIVVFWHISNIPPNDFKESNLLWYHHILYSSNICEILLYNQQLFVITHELIYSYWANTVRWVGSQSCSCLVTWFALDWEQNQVTRQLHLCDPTHMLGHLQAVMNKFGSCIFRFRHMFVYFRQYLTMIYFCVSGEYSTYGHLWSHSKKNSFFLTPYNSQF